MRLLAVLEVGQEVQGLKAGDKVVVEPIRYCGECYACRKGQPNVCEQLSVLVFMKMEVCVSVCCC